jgi:RNA chaperone Hfq
MESNLLDRMLSTYMEARTPVTVTLQNRIRVSGRIKAFDSYVIIVEGQKKEIVYRHAVSCLTASVVQESRRAAEPLKPSLNAPVARPQKPAMRKPRTEQVPALSAASRDTSINTTMKDGLLRWMQEQKSPK